jgi:hypothetical protein
LGEHGKNGPQKLMGSSQDCLFERKAILSSLLIVLSKTVIELNDPDGHEPDHPPEMAIPTFGNPALPIMLTGLIDGRINARHGDQFFMIVELPDITSHLHKEACRRLLANPPQGSHDINVIPHTRTAQLNHHGRQFFQMTFQMNQHIGLLFEDQLP